MIDQERDVRRFSIQEVPRVLYLEDHMGFNGDTSLVVLRNAVHIPIAQGKPARAFDLVLGERVPLEKIHAEAYDIPFLACRDPRRVSAELIQRVLKRGEGPLFFTTAPNNFALRLHEVSPMEQPPSYIDKTLPYALTSLELLEKHLPNQEMSRIQIALSEGVNLRQPVDEPADYL